MHLNTHTSVQVPLLHLKLITLFMMQQRWWSYIMIICFVLAPFLIMCRQFVIWKKKNYSRMFISEQFSFHFAKIWHLLLSVMWSIIVPFSLSRFFSFFLDFLVTSDWVLNHLRIRIAYNFKFQRTRNGTAASCRKNTIKYFKWTYNHSVFVGISTGYVIRQLVNAFSCACIELRMHLGSMKSTQEARVTLSKLPACIHNSMYAPKARINC